MVDVSRRGVMGQDCLDRPLRISEVVNEVVEFNISHLYFKHVHLLSLEKCSVFREYQSLFLPLNQSYGELLASV